MFGCSGYIDRAAARCCVQAFFWNVLGISFDSFCIVLIDYMLFLFSVLHLHYVYATSVCCIHS